MPPRPLTRLASRSKQFASLLLLFGLASSVARAADAAITKFTATRAGEAVHVTVEASDASLWANTQLLIDTDNDPKTGFRAAGRNEGFDVMVEGAAVYTFKGSDPAAWSWTNTGNAARSVSGTTLTYDLPLAALPGSQSAVLMSLRALSKDYQKVLATAPAGAALSVDLVNDAPPSSDSPAVEKPAFSATTTQDGTDLVVKITSATAADLNTTLIFFDTDGNAATGFNPPADPRFGFEYMIQGNMLSRHTDGPRDAWAWQALGPVKQTVTGNTAEVRFNASLLKPTKLKVAAWQMTPDWQSRTAFSPAENGKAGAADVAIDASKLRAAISPNDAPLAPVHANAALPPRQRFAGAKSYACYYGGGSLGPLSRVDAAILHVPAMTPADVKQLNAIGTVTIGYISVGEDEKLRVANGTGYDGKASWYFDKDKDGKPDMNGIWGSVYANAADPAWRADRVAEAKRLCDANGHDFQGIFLDTLDTVDVYPASRQGMIQLIQELRAALPDKVIVANRGFGILAEPEVASNVDGVMFEDFSTTYDFAAKAYLTLTPSDMDATRAVMTSSIAQANKINKLKVLALDYCEPAQADRIQMSFDRAVSYGMLPAVAPIALDMVYDTSNVVARPDEKYLRVQATPEAMRYTLDVARNGFPAGTVVEPSSCYFGYTVATVVDGIADHSATHWMRASWASAEAPGSAQQLLFALPEPAVGGSLEITFALDNKTWYPSRDFAVDVSADGSNWKTIAHPTENAEHQFRCPLPAGAMRQVRITQSAGGGSTERPNLMWIQQVKRLP